MYNPHHCITHDSSVHYKLIVDLELMKRKGSGQGYTIDERTIHQSHHYLLIYTLKHNFETSRQVSGMF